MVWWCWCCAYSLGAGAGRGDKVKECPKPLVYSDFAAGEDDLAGWEVRVELAGFWRDGMGRGCSLGTKKEESRSTYS